MDLVPFDYILQVWHTMYIARQHTFQILTKRPERMMIFLTEWLPSAWQLAYFEPYPGPLPNIWLGVTAENQQAADERREYLEAVPAAVKFVSYEPALGTVNWSGWEFLDLLISGGETGPGARPSHVQWFRGARDFCQANGIAFHHKQHGEWIRYSDASDDVRLDIDSGKYHDVFVDWKMLYRVGNKRAGHLLDGVEYR